MSKAARRVMGQSKRAQARDKRQPNGLLKSLQGARKDLQPLRTPAVQTSKDGSEVKDSSVDLRIRNVQGGCNVIVRQKFAIFVPTHSPVTADQIVWIIERALGRREH